VLLCALVLGCRESSERQQAAVALAPPTLTAVLSGLPAGRPLALELVTDRGPIHCELEPERTPGAAALFIGFALGRAAWRDPKSGRTSRRPLYRDLPFVRGVPGVLIQSGDPVGNTTGHPGYRIPVEARADDVQRLARPGALILARYTPPPNRIDPDPPPPGHVLGSQFALLLTNMAHLAGQVSVLGSCGDLETARAIADELTAQRARPRLIEVRVR
jgi:peptidyl-prolyl cis-trans isomerase A (cyclophilin A)